MRRATPDSEALGSSEDEKPWPTAPSFGSLPRKENGVPGIGGGIWSTQRRGSFKMEKAAHRNAARDARLGAPNQPRMGLRAESTPSPAASESSAALPFAIPLQPTPKAGRSLSHSQGQRENLQALGTRPSSNEHAPVLPLGLLTEEEVDTETESELGGALTQTTSHPPIGTLQRTSTYPSTYDAYHASRQASNTAAGAPQTAKVDRRFEAAFSNLTFAEPPQRRGQWQSHLGWDDVPNVNESRRHSLAELPTRRGSLVGGDRLKMGGGDIPPHGLPWKWDERGQGLNNSEEDYIMKELREGYDYGHIVTGPNGTEGKVKQLPGYEAYRKFKSDPANAQLEELNDIPSMYRAPHVTIKPSELSDADKKHYSNINRVVGPWGGPGAPRSKELFIVSFKCSRVEVFYLLNNTGLFIKPGDIVIVEADRGQDLGTVQHANISTDEARLYKRKYGEEQYKWLMMFSKNNSQGSVNPNAQVYGENNAARGPLIGNAPATMQGLPRDNYNNLKPKAIKRLALSHEIKMLGEKEGNEAKAKRACHQKVQQLGLDMEILDAEWQWDFQKLIFYYYADHYINFKDLITELYRIYKTRIWLSAINPASFSQHALGQPPSGIGPGAITGSSEANDSYTMTYGPDPDPYGAIPPYRIGYDTYTPNYPGIPGVANSFAPNTAMTGGFQAYGNGNAAPSIPPGVTLPTTTPADYSYHYERSINTDPSMPKPFSMPPLPRQWQNSGVPFEQYYPQYAASPSGGPSEHGGYGHVYQGFNNGPSNNASSGFGSQTAMPPPIGTRPQPNGSAFQTTFANAMSPTSRELLSRADAEVRAQINELGAQREATQKAWEAEPKTVLPEWQEPEPYAGIYDVREQDTVKEQASNPYFNAVRDSMSHTAGDTTQRANWTGLGGDKSKVMRSYLDNLQSKENERKRDGGGDAA